MKPDTFLIFVILFAMMISVGCLAQDATSFEDLYRIGQAHQEADRYENARAAYEKALEFEGITTDQTGKALVRIAATYISEKHLQGGIPLLRRVRAMEDLSNEILIEANILFATAYLKSPWVLDQSRDAFLEIIDLPELSPEQTTIVRKGLIKAYMGLKQFTEARTIMLALATDANLTPTEKLTNQISIGTTFVLEEMYAEARAELRKALTLPGITNAQKADIQLKTALSYYETGDFERAKPELEKVLTMPGADAPPFRSDGFGNYIVSCSREARLRLLKMDPSAEKQETIAVLFIGGSLTLRGLMPYVIEEIAASAPPERPRIMAGMYTRGGTTLDTFWEDGSARNSARGMITSMPWDAVVIATFYKTNLEDLLKYGKLFGDLIESEKAKPLFYECQLRQAAPYPKANMDFHADNVVLRKTLDIPVAPVALAMTRYLGDTATPEQIGTLYSDYIHYSPKGMYLVAYCLYATITGYSPVGLYHPEDMPKEEALALQEAAWKAVCETNPNLKPWK